LGTPRPETALGRNILDCFSVQDGTWGREPPWEHRVQRLRLIVISWIVFGPGWYLGPRAVLGTPRSETALVGNFFDCLSVQDGTGGREPPWEHRVQRVRLVGISWIVFRTGMIPGAASRLGNTASRDCVLF
jgi:hypothetical protein